MGERDKASEEQTHKGMKPSTKAGGFPLRSSDPLVNDETFSETIVELMSYGLTAGQARICLFLLIKGASTVRIISKSLDVHRVDVYRRLKELEEFEILEQYLDTPKRYGVVAPEYLVMALLKRHEGRLTELRERSAQLLPKLSSLQRSFGVTKMNSDEDSNNLYRLGVGQTRYHNEMVGLMRGTRNEVLRVLSCDGIIRNFNSGFYKEYFDARKRGVRIRMISEINASNRSQAKSLSKAVEFRHLNGIHLRLSVFDKSTVVFGTSYRPRVEDTEENSYLVLHDTKFAEVFRFLFEHLWKIASAPPFDG